VSGTFLDTSGLYAAARPAERDHARCAAAYQHLLTTSGALVTTELILAELHALAVSRVGPTRALLLARRMTSTSRIEAVPIDEGLRTRALDLLAERLDHSYSLTDAVSFVVMRDRSLDTAFTLDADFAAEGFQVVPA
jgi:predicted nucleic acid-binding protein